MQTAITTRSVWIITGRKTFPETVKKQILILIT